MPVSESVRKFFRRFKDNKSDSAPTSKKPKNPNLKLPQTSRSGIFGAGHGGVKAEVPSTVEEEWESSLDIWNEVPGPRHSTTILREHESLGPSHLQKTMQRPSKHRPYHSTTNLLAEIHPVSPDEHGNIPINHPTGSSIEPLTLRSRKAQAAKAQDVSIPEPGPSDQILTGDTSSSSSVFLQENAENTAHADELTASDSPTGPLIDQPVENYELDTRSEGLRHSYDAEYKITKNIVRGPCMPKTRTTVLEGLMEWCQAKGALLCWMSGTAGAGKTTIAFSACQMLENMNVLGASFFCSRLLPDCRNIKLILPTIAMQLSRQYPPFGEALAAALEKDANIQERGLDEQLHRLIVDPWAEKKKELPEHAVVVLDALDECDVDQAIFLRMLYNNITKLPFKILVTSRPESTIQDIVNAKDPSTVSTFILDDIEDTMVRTDIARYLKSQLSNCTAPDTISTIADIAGPLFISASTLTRLAISTSFNMFALLQILQRSSSFMDKPEMVASLDEIYKSALTVIFSQNLTEIEKTMMENVLQTILCAREPLTPEIIAELWGIEEGRIKKQLDLLSPILAIPDGRNCPIIVLHSSLPEFMLDSSRSGRFCCRSLATNLQFSKQCLAILHHKLRPNLCQVHDYQSNDPISPDLITTHISPSLRYATTYIIEHWALSDIFNSQVALDLIYEFLKKHLLCWVECLSLLGKPWVSIQGLEIMLDALDEDADNTAVGLAYDTLRLVQYTYDCIRNNATEIYHSALAWTPLHSPLRVHYAPFFAQAPRVLCGFPTSWPGPEQVLKIHSRPITSVAVSRDGNRIALRSWDSTVRIWDMRNGVEEFILRLEDHGRWVHPATISQSGDRVVSGSDVGNIHVWNMATCQAISTLSASPDILAVSLSPDDRLIASVHLSLLICIWDVSDGKLVYSFEGHEDRISSVLFFPGSTSLISVSYDKTSRIWNLLTGKTDHILLGHSAKVYSVACSPTGDKVITGSDDKTARLWSPSGEALQVLRGHSSMVSAVAFLPDAKRVVTGSYDGTLRVWDVATGDTVHIFTETLAEPVLSVAVFPDGLRVASCSFQSSQIAIWSLREQVPNNGGEGLPSLPPKIKAESMIFSSNGRKVLLLPSLRILDTETLEKKAAIRPQGSTRKWALSKSGSRAAAVVAGNAVDVWQLIGDNAMRKSLTLKGHTKTVHSLSFSNDERHLISASDDCTARVWDVVTGIEIQVFQHRSSVHHASFSHDETRIICTARNVVCIWDIRTGEQLDQFDVGTQSVRFTPGDQYFIASDKSTTRIFNVKTSELVHWSQGYDYWTTLDDGSSYGTGEDGWVYHFPRFHEQPRKLLWIPSPYRPYLSSKSFPVHGPMFSQTSQGVRLCLPRNDSLVTLIIPHSQ